MFRKGRRRFFSRAEGTFFSPLRVIVVLVLFFCFIFVFVFHPELLSLGSSDPTLVSLASCPLPGDSEGSPSNSGESSPRAKKKAAINNEELAETLTITFIYFLLFILLGNLAGDIVRRYFDSRPDSDSDSDSDSESGLGVD